MAPLRIFIDGPPLAGCYETHLRIGERSIPPQRVWRDKVLDWTSKDSTLLQVRGRIDTSLVYDLVDDADKKPSWAAQRDYLVGVDGLIFVVDSQCERLEAGQHQLAQLHHALVRLGRDPEQVPMVFQLNKRDIRGVMSERELREHYRWPICGYVSTVATTGVGINELLVAVETLLDRSHR
jgi:hypothetical protein